MFRVEKDKAKTNYRPKFQGGSIHKSISTAGLLLIAAGTTSVLAADLPSAKGAPVFVPPPPVLSWTGLYIGGQVGVQWGQTGWNRYDVTNTTVIAPQLPYTNNGVTGGGHIGYNYQLNQFVLGLEGDVEGTNYKGNGISNGNAWVNTTRADIEASIRGRAGIAWNQLLVYVTGGAAYENFHLTAQNPPGIFYAGNDFSRIGWTAGGGVEYTFNSHWSMRIEDRISDFGHNTLFTGTENLREDLLDNRVEAGVSYKFDLLAPAKPVIAKY
jgi:outer membrane immunogenic protein